MNSISVFAPATVANVACGFDIFGFAVANPGDKITLTVRDEPGVRITDIIGDEGRLPRGIGVTRLIDAPLEWSRQRDMLGL